jgi:hypothetical protein
VVGVVVITQGWAMILAFVGMVLLLGLAHVLIVGAQPKSSGSTDNVAKRRRGVKALVMGADGRASTSKLQAVLWTFAVFYAFLFLLIWGRSLGCDQERLRAEELALCSRATEERQAFAEIVGRELQADYYVLLGFPLGVAVAARALTTAKVAAGAITKSPNEQSEGVVQGLRETISNDRGETDLLDFQYFAFNLLTLAFFWTEFLTDPSTGLPDLPATLIGLSGLSAAAYTTRKALEQDVKPAVSTVIPRRIVLAEGTRVSVIGSGFGDRESSGALDDKTSPPATVLPPAWVKVDGIPVEAERWAATRIDALLTAEFVAQHPGATERPTPAELVVDVDGRPPSEPFSIELVPSSPTGPRPDSRE